MFVLLEEKQKARIDRYTRHGVDRQQSAQEARNDTLEFRPVNIETTRPVLNTKGELHNAMFYLGGRGSLDRMGCLEGLLNMEKLKSELEAVCDCSQ
ncbi:hypothetical protein YC2023_016576 [Brassica napus]